MSKVINLGLVEGRHEMPVDGYVLESVFQRMYLRRNFR